MPSLIRSLCAQIGRFRGWDGPSYVDLLLKDLAASRALPYLEHLEEVTRQEWPPRPADSLRLYEPEHGSLLGESDLVRPENPSELAAASFSRRFAVITPCSPQDVAIWSPEAVYWTHQC